MGKRLEVWKPIKGYEDLYEVSNMGRVRSLIFRNGTSSRPRVMIMSPTDNGNGYLIAGLKLHTVRKNHYVHRLVAGAYCENPNGYKYVNHIDHNKQNNNASNLEWCTQRQNVLHSVDRMRKPRKNCKPSSTGFKYITKRQTASGEIRYRVQVINKKEKLFKTLHEALEHRHEVLNG